MSVTKVVYYSLIMAISAGNCIFFMVHALPINKKNKVKVVVFLLLKLALGNFAGAFMPYVMEKSMMRDSVMLFLDYGSLILMIYLLTKITEASLIKICTVLLGADFVTCVGIYVPMIAIPSLMGYTQTSFLETSWNGRILLYFLCILLSVILVHLCTFRYYCKLRNAEIKHKRIFGGIFIVYLFAQIIISLTEQKGNPFFIQAEKATPIIILIGLIVFIGVTFMKKNTQLCQEYDALIEEQKMIEEHLYEMQKQEEMIQTFRRESINHLQRFQDDKLLDRDEEVERYLTQLKEKYQSLKNVDYCDNITMNALLYQKEKIANKNGIALHINMSKMKEKDEQNMNLFMITHYVLDYVIQECDQTDLKKTDIDFRCGQVANQQVIVCSYPIDDRTNAGDELETKTIRKQKEKRMLSLKKKEERKRTAMLEKIVKQNNGDMQIQQEEGYKHITVLMNITKNVQNVTDDVSIC